MERDVTKVTTEEYFVKTLRRMADAIEAGEAWRIQVAGVRIKVPEDAEVSVEHEVVDGAHELEFQFRWTERDA